jgi:hypothetical protein
LAVSTTPWKHSLLIRCWPQSISGSGDIGKFFGTPTLQEYWRENSETLPVINGYSQALPHIVLNSFLQKILTGGVEFLIRDRAREKRHLDLLAKYKGVAYPIVLKIKANQRSLAESLAQIRDYMNICRAKEGWLMIFNNDMKGNWEKKITWETREYEGMTIHLVGC